MARGLHSPVSPSFLLASLHVASPLQSPLGPPIHPCLGGTWKLHAALAGGLGVVALGVLYAKLALSTGGAEPWGP